MSSLKNVFRLLFIYKTLVRNGLDEVLREVGLFNFLGWFFYISPAYWWRDQDTPRAERLRVSLEELGPIFIKFGQILSTRRDLLPDDIADELAKLQDRVKPFSTALALELLEQAYGKPASEVFAEFDPEPLAAASIAQVHSAVLHTGESVVVKILRPDVKARIIQDVAILHLLARLAQRYWKDGRRLRPIEVVDEFEKHLHDELDLLREAGNCAILRRNFNDSDQLYVPDVKWEYVRENVLVLERIQGIPIGQVSVLAEQGVNFKYLAEIGVEIFFTQVFRDNFFHADMHPGNIFVDVSNPDKPSYIAVDFGIMGTLSEKDKQYLAENFLAFFQRDYRRVAELHISSGWVPLGTREEDFEGAIRSVCEPIFNRPIKEISFGLLLLRLFQTARRFNMQIQPQLVLLQKTLLNIEGMGRQLYPDLDLWQTAQPYLERWMRDRMGPKALFHQVQQQFPYWTENLPKLPMLVHDALQQHQQQQLQTQQELSALREALISQQQQQQQINRGAALLLSGSILLAVQQTPFGDASTIGLLLSGLGLVLLLSSFLK